MYWEYYFFRIFLHIPVKIPERKIKRILRNLLQFENTVFHAELFQL